MDFHIQNKIPIYEYTNHTLVMTCSFCLCPPLNTLQSSLLREGPKAPKARVQGPGSFAAEGPVPTRPTESISSTGPRSAVALQATSDDVTAVELSTLCGEVVPKGESDVKP